MIDMSNLEEVYKKIIENYMDDDILHVGIIENEIWIYSTKDREDIPTTIDDVPIRFVKCRRRPKPLAE